MEIIKKIAVKVWQPVIDKLDKKIESGCLRRDAYIGKVLAIELERLDEEITQPNSPAARDFVAAKLNLLNRKVVTFSLRADLIDRLDKICNGKRIVRDAIFNRILLLLTATPPQIDRLLLLDSDWQNTVWKEHGCDWSFFPNIFYPLEPNVDPFWVIREGIKLTNSATGSDNSFYRAVLTDKHFKNADIWGLNCYLPDEYVPNTPVRQKFLDDLDDL